MAVNENVKWVKRIGASIGTCLGFYGGTQLCKETGWSIVLGILFAVLGAGAGHICGWFIASDNTKNDLH